jgi:hypothetical protein
MFTVQRCQLAVAFFAFVIVAGPVCAANWVVFDETQMMPLCYDRDGIHTDSQGLTHFSWRFKHQSCTDKASLSTEFESAVRCAQDTMSGDIKGITRLRAMEQQFPNFEDEMFERGTEKWRLARTVCGKR